MAPDPLEEYPRQVARTRGFTLGQPRSFTVSPDGSRVVFLRSMAGDDPVSCLWVLDPSTGEERVVFDPRRQGLGDEGRLSEAERARRERVRERSSGVTAYATDREVRRIVFTVSGRPFVADLVEDWVDELTVPGTVDDPRLDPSGRRVAYVVEGALHVRDLAAGNRVLAADDDRQGGGDEHLLPLVDASFHHEPRHARSPPHGRGPCRSRTRGRRG